MQVLLVTIGSHGDVHPFVGIGAAMLARGHRVTLVTNGLFEPLARSVGLEFVELGTEAEFRRAIGNPDVFHRTKGFKAVFGTGVLPYMRPAYELIKSLYVPGEMVMVAHSIAFGARMAEDKLGIPA